MQSTDALSEPLDEYSISSQYIYGGEYSPPVLWFQDLRGSSDMFAPTTVDEYSAVLGSEIDDWSMEEGVDQSSSPSWDETTCEYWSQVEKTLIQFQQYNSPEGDISRCQAVGWNLYQSQ